MAGGAGGGEFADPAVGAWVNARRTPHPVGCFAEPVQLPRPLEDCSFSRTCIKATGDPRPGPDGPRSVRSFWAAADRAARSPAWRYRQVATGHMVPINRPDDLTRLLLELG